MGLRSFLLAQTAMTGTSFVELVRLKIYFALGLRTIFVSELLRFRSARVVSCRALVVFFWSGVRENAFLGLRGRLFCFTSGLRRFCWRCTFRVFCCWAFALGGARGRAIDRIRCHVMSSPDLYVIYAREAAIQSCSCCLIAACPSLPAAD